MIRHNCSYDKTHPATHTQVCIPLKPIKCLKPRKLFRFPSLKHTCYCFYKTHSVTQKRYQVVSWTPSSAYKAKLGNCSRTMYIIVHVKTHSLSPTGDEIGSNSALLPVLGFSSGDYIFRRLLVNHIFNK